MKNNYLKLLTAGVVVTVIGLGLAACSGKTPPAATTSASSTSDTSVTVPASQTTPAEVNQHKTKTAPVLAPSPRPQGQPAKRPLQSGIPSTN